MSSHKNAGDEKRFELEERVKGIFVIPTGPKVAAG
jgi:hypothetical protein